MARNIEIKARVDDLTSLERRVAPLADAGPTAIHQDDTFFHCPSGRLKLRVFDDGQGELIAYARDDAAGPKLSDYVRSATADPASLRDALARALGVRGRVVKQRTLYLIGPTRVHLDRVDGLGDFVELEVVLADHQTAADGQDVAHALLATLDIAPGQLLTPAYIDLIEQRP